MPSTLLNDTFLRALQRQPTDYTPIWLMRQAGRYLPEYNATRSRAGSFMGLATNPDYATEVTLQPLERFPLDAAILFSDILTIPDAMGLGLNFVQGEGPRFERTVRTEEDVAKLHVPDIDATLRYVTDAVSQIRRALTDAQGRQKVPLIGFSGSPWTLACYMVEGGGSPDHHTVKAMAYTRPDLMHRILDINAQAVVAYLNAQIEAGAQAVMIFDTWGGALADGAYQRFSLDYIAKVVAGLKREHEGVKVPVITFTKGGGLWLEQIAAVGVDAVGLDWTMNLRQAREKVGDRVALQGNIDPSVLFASPAVIRTEARAVLDSFGNFPGHVFNLGHGISQFTRPENVAELVDEVHRHSRAIRAKT
ncbi:MAG: uroporphyrinogen decarboxylase [Caballeronia sp.]|uniref:uroporphyrinogen decarboxylase n=1 Tax=Caballeronia sp. TaxID=1931223 RepID=UPI00260B35B3|nr:uroporphyrinogen decarboxylase [Caballeronia sp.]MDB5833035.1 uroporphyrinogen decarboxylase [Caballeronia sp.]